MARNSLARHTCLVLDYRLPGIDGLSLLNLLPERGETCRAVIITSNPTRAMRQRTTAAGAVLVEKPLLSDSLTIAIRQLIHGSNLATCNGANEAFGAAMKRPVVSALRRFIS